MKIQNHPEPKMNLEPGPYVLWTSTAQITSLGARKMPTEHEERCVEC